MRLWLGLLALGWLFYAVDSITAGRVLVIRPRRWVSFESEARWVLATAPGRAVDWEEEAD